MINFGLLWQLNAIEDFLVLWYTYTYLYMHCNGVLYMKRLTIGVIIGNANSPHTRNLMEGVNEAARELDVNVIFFLGVHMANNYQAYFGDMMDYNYDYQYNIVYDYSMISAVDAVIVSYGSLCIFLEDPNRERFMKRFGNLPYVILEDTDETGRGSYIISDNYNGMYAVVEHLVTVHGYTKFAFLAGPENNTDATERRIAFNHVLAKYGIPVTDEMIEVGNYSGCVEPQINALLDNNPGLEALVCANDVMADTAYKECEKRGLKVGVDIAITGYDNWNLAEKMTPPLTTVVQDELKMGAAAVRRIVEQIKTGVTGGLIEPADLIVRGSCGCEYERSQAVEIEELKASKDFLDSFQNDTMLMPYLSRDMITHIDDETAFYRAPMKMLSSMRAKSSYIFLLEEPVSHKAGEGWTQPTTMKLASYHEGKRIVSFNPSARPTITMESGLYGLHDRDDLYAISTFALFQGEMQYGILLTEVDPSDMLLMNLASMQISNAIDFKMMYERQEQLKNSLQKLYDEVEEKNRVLGFISEYDQLTGCLNRRGYLEQAMSFMHEHAGKKAILLESDLDHLKEINDTFGHAEGDFAIKSSADILRKALGSNVLVARMGGDEFVALCLNEGGLDGERLKQKIREIDEAYNLTTGKPYYVNLSVGYKEFVCKDEIELTDLVKEADVKLYEAKKRRRESIRRDV